ncbi:hypothetical protein DM02DRAFT_662567 [Periconia macrospinosa]|uniref:Uncharacterized protein n=1 Tax=Periconia macrospinosa TaxID=97972 RepID=A0A2V1D5N9_9PLEO|nr:hypothetical protein DM02DRAFT_662567 [Periconia macrospinosa]
MATILSRLDSRLDLTRRSIDAARFHSLDKLGLENHTGQGQPGLTLCMTLVYITMQSGCSQSRYSKCLLHCESTEAALPDTTDSPGLGYTKSKFSRVPHDELGRLATNMSA